MEMYDDEDPWETVEDNARKQKVIQQKRHEMH